MRKAVFIIAYGNQLQPGETFFIKEKGFFYGWASLMALIASQNLVAYSVNMADNVMLGSYSQSALSGAAIVNQIFFVVQKICVASSVVHIAITCYNF